MKQLRPGKGIKPGRDHKVIIWISSRKIEPTGDGDIVFSREYSGQVAERAGGIDKERFNAEAGNQ